MKDNIYFKILTVALMVLVVELINLSAGMRQKESFHAIRTLVQQSEKLDSLKKQRDIIRKEIKFRLGNENLLRNISYFDFKRVGLVTNHTGILSNGDYLLDELLARRVDVKLLFSPEHGIRGNEVYTGMDSITGLRIISLHGAKTKPSMEDLDSLDALIYDIQDVGARFYTYTSTLYYVIESAVENNKEIIVCDRPIISDPDYVDGFLLDTNFRSFVGTIPTPVVYGMSSGELAKFINGEAFGGKANLKIYPMSGYKRSTDYSSLKLKWIKPSPSIITPMAAVIYPSTCFLEGTNVNEGRGTDRPFEYFGAPWMNSKLVLDTLKSFILEGVRFDSIRYTPTQIISDHKPKYLYEECNGISITVTDKRTFEPVKTGIAILLALHKNHPEFQFNPNNFIDKLAGTDQLRLQITEGKGYYDIINSYEKDLRYFDFIRSKYLIYN